MSGIDIHGGLRVRFEGGVAAYSAEPGASDETVLSDVREQVRRLRLRIAYLEAWLTQWKLQTRAPGGGATPEP